LVKFGEVFWVLSFKKGKIENLFDGSHIWKKCCTWKKEKSFGKILRSFSKKQKIEICFTFFFFKKNDDLDS
jgi:hypothetical protein